MTSTQERPASFAASWKKLRFPATHFASSRRLVVGSCVEALVKLDGPSLTCDSTLDVRCPTLIHEVHRHTDRTCKRPGSYSIVKRRLPSDQTKGGQYVTKH